MADSQNNHSKIQHRKSPALAGLSHDEQPICALTTGGGAAIGVIRVSGIKAIDLVMQLVPKLATKGQVKYRHAYFLPVIDPSNQETVDDALVLFFKGPSSFTGQDSVEIHCHGGSYIIQRLLKLLMELGCRAAEPGEFTKRAFLSGKIDLTAAEGIKELVEAASHHQWQAARQLATGTLKGAIDDLREKLIKAMAYLEAMIDFPDEGDTQSVHLGQVEVLTKAVDQQIRVLVGTYNSGKIARNGLGVALIGMPNAGKSTLMNKLLDRDRAIVTDIAGTTRDYIEEPCLINGRLIRLIDTAGIRDTDNPVERIGVEEAHRFAREADLVIALCPSDAEPDQVAFVQETLVKACGNKLMSVVTKSDLGSSPWEQDFDMSISCHADNGIDNLKSCLAQKVDNFTKPLAENLVISSVRQKQGLEEALGFLDNFFGQLASGGYEECLAFELQQAAESLGTVIGEVSNDEILGKIFSDFCVGK